MKLLGKNRGLAFILVMFAMGILAATTLGIAYLGNQGLLQSKAQAETDSALYLAEGALNLKIAQVKIGDETDITDLDFPPPRPNEKYTVQVFSPGETAPLNGGMVMPAQYYFIMAEGTSEGDKVRRVGAVLRKSTSSFNAAIVAGNNVTMGAGSYTDTFDSTVSPTAPGDDSLAKIALWSPSASISLDPTAFVGQNGGVGVADIVGPSGGGAGQVSGGVAGVNFNSFVVNSLIQAPPPVPSRAASGSNLSVSGVGNVQTVTPSLVGGEYVFSANNVNVDTGGKLVFDISGVPNGEVAHFDFKKLDLASAGTIEVYDGGVTDAVVELYVDNKFEVTGGSFLNPSLNPDRFKVMCEHNRIKLEVASSAYIVAQSNSDVIVDGGSAIYGAVIADNIEVLGASAVHYDQALATNGTGGVSMVLVNYRQYGD